MAPLIFVSVTLLYFALSNATNFVFTPGAETAGNERLYVIQLREFRNSVWLPMSEIQIGIGLLIASGLVLLVAVKEWRLPSVLTRAGRYKKSLLRLNRLFLFIEPFALVLIVVGIVGYGFLTFINLTYNMTWFGARWAKHVEHLFRFRYFPGKNWLGVAAFTSLFISTCAAMARWIGHGLSVAFRRAIIHVAAPLTFGWTVVLFLTHPSSMVWHAVNFLPWSVAGVDLVSNWLVLVVSGFFTAVGLFELSTTPNKDVLDQEKTAVRGS